MNLELRKYCAADAIELISRKAKQPSLVLDLQVQGWAKLKETRGPALTSIWNGTIASCGGLEIVWPGVAEAWFIVCEADKMCNISVAAATKEKLDDWIKEYELVRVQSPLRADFPQGVRFAKWLGFEYESIMPKYHPDGCTAWMYSRIIER